jgi:hypothetical protein
MSLLLFTRLFTVTGIGLGLMNFPWLESPSQPFIHKAFQNAYQGRTSIWWMQKQQLKKGEEEVKQPQKAISNTRVEAGPDRDR